MLQEDLLAKQARDTMGKQKFIHRLDAALHWYLPKAEADEVLADYQDIQRQASQNDEQLLGHEQDARTLTRELYNPREYRRWLLIFGVLLLCPLASLAYALNPYIDTFFSWYHPPVKSGNFLFIAGLLLTLLFTHLWKRQPGEPGRSPRLLALAGLLLLFDLIGGGLAVYLYYRVWLGHYGYYNITTGALIDNYLIFLALFNSLICLAALIKCRLRSCRWLGVYLIGLTMLLGIVYYLSVFRCMDVSMSSLAEETGLLRRYLWAAVCGLAASLKILG